MEKATIIIHGPSQRQFAISQIEQAPAGWSVTIKEAKRTDLQNRKLWPMLQDVSRQVEWYGNRLTSDEWKDVFTAALKKEKVVPGINGGFVVLGQRTSQMSKRVFAELVELIYAFGAEHGVAWSEPREDAA